MNQEEEPRPLWCYAPISRFERPAEPAVQAARSGLQALWKRMRQPVDAGQPLSVQAELHCVPQRLLDRVAAPPRWDAAVQAVNATLDGWVASDCAEQPVRVIIGPPGTGVRQVVSTWAEQKGLRIVQAPSYREILYGSTDWMDQIKREGDDLLVIPNLECYLLRHYNGLEGVRLLVQEIDASKRRFVIGCSSWAWTYLSRVVQIDALLPEPLTLAAFDGLRLQSWFQLLAAGGSGWAYVFRQADDGSHVLPRAGPNIEAGKRGTSQDEEPLTEERVSPFLQRIGARSRGNPLVAWAAWRHCLNIAQGEEVEEVAQEAAASDRGRTLWVRPWPQMEFPVLPPGTRSNELFLLHALLLHDGLPAAILASLLPLGTPEIMQGLYRLRSAGLVKEEEGLWRVTLLGYPAVRNALAGEDLLVDGF